MIILNTSRMDHHFQQVAQRIHGNMPFASVDLFACIIATLAASFGRLDALGVDRTSTRIFVSTPLAAVQLAQSRVDPSPGTVPTPFTVMVVYAVVIGIIFRQVLPLAAGAYHKEYAIHYLAHIQFYGSTWPLTLQWQQRLDRLPLIITHITCVTLLLLRQCALLFGWNRLGLTFPYSTKQEFSNGLLDPIPRIPDGQGINAKAYN